MASIDYTSDFGIVYYTIPFIFFVTSEKTNNIIDQYEVEEIVPNIILNARYNLEDLGDKNCSLPKSITSRKIQLIADDANIYTFLFPFNFSDTRFVGVINQLEGSAIIQKFTIIGEKIKSDKLQAILKINGY